ncbi:hypothetical protein [Klebsiella pneumoniae]
MLRIGAKSISGVNPGIDQLLLVGFRLRKTRAIDSSVLSVSARPSLFFWI